MPAALAAMMILEFDATVISQVPLQSAKHLRPVYPYMAMATARSSEVLQLMAIHATLSG